MSSSPPRGPPAVGGSRALAATSADTLPPEQLSAPTHKNGADGVAKLDERELLRVLQEMRDGNFSVRLPADTVGLAGKIADAFNETALMNERMAGLLTQSLRLAGELQTRQVGLQQTNDELACKARLLAEQNFQVQRKNQEIEAARRALEEKAAELALTSRCKSEFLANMSHELRTPLNSILILGRQLAENGEGNLSDRQIEFATTIHAAGTDLLDLIGDILDLSKIESGTVSVEAGELQFTHLQEVLERNFRHEAEKRRLSFTTGFDPRLGRSMITDRKRLMQIMKNLLSNAFKFTERGGVRLQVAVAAGGWSSEHPTLSKAHSVIAFAVSDTGVGIPADRQRIVFEAFQQADACTARKYGGTGLGLAISRELAMLLGGEIRLSSVPGSGSTFTLYLPQSCVGAAGGEGERGARDSRAATPAAIPVPGPRTEVADDRDGVQEGDEVLLIIEDDARFSRVLLNLARDNGLRGVVAHSGAQAIELARRCRPTVISLDVFLPDMLGWTVLNRLKRDPRTRHIPVQVLTIEEEHHYGLERGAFSVLNKRQTPEGLKNALLRIRDFAQRTMRELLVVEDDHAEQVGICELLAGEDLTISTASTGGEALEMLRERRFDCMVLDLRLPDMSGFELIGRLRERSGEPTDSTRAGGAEGQFGRAAAWQDNGRDRGPEMPIVAFTNRELSAAEESELRAHARSIILKDVQSPERLLDETALFLHRVIGRLPPKKQKMIESLQRSDEALRGRRVLVVDDDIRNIFALNSLLERHGVRVLRASNGRDAIKLIETTRDLALVLMDIMMPELDGYETMRRIRADARFRPLPIIALTARAMQGDRQKCFDAGASDYVAKPVDSEQLLSLVRTWLHR